MRLLGYLRGNLIALAALFVALGGTAWAASKVGSGDIRSDAVLARHIADGQVGKSELKPAGRSLSFTDGTQSIGSSFTDVSFDEFRVSDDGALQASEGLVVVERSAVYALDGEIHWSIDGTGDRRLRLLVTDDEGDSRVIASDRRRAANAETTGSVSTTEPITAGSVVSLQASQTSAAPLPTDDFDGYSARLAIQSLGPPTRIAP